MSAPVGMGSQLHAPIPNTQSPAVLPIFPGNTVPATLANLSFEMVCFFFITLSFNGSCTSLPCYGGRVNVQSHKHVHFFLCQSRRISFVNAQFLWKERTNKRKKKTIMRRFRETNLSLEQSAFASSTCIFRNKEEMPYWCPFS